MLRRTLVLLLALLSCRPTGERRASPSDNPLSITDDAGRPITLAAPARRVVSLAPSSTELLFALGAGDQVVGRTTWCRYPAAALRVPVVGDGLNPNVEAIAAQRPDLVVLYRSALNAAAVTQLEQLHIPAVILAQDRLEDVSRAARRLGGLTGHAAAGDSIAYGIDALLAPPPQRTEPPLATLTFVVWDTPPMVIGAGSYLDQLATLAGAKNVFGDLTTASATVSLETIAARDPDVIVILSDTTQVAGLLARREWRAIRAVRERRFVVLPADLFGRPSPAVPAAVAAFRQALLAARPR